MPPFSPFGLLQESLWPNHWLILVSCMLLNQTSRKQVEKVLPEFIRRWPTPQAFLGAADSDVAGLCKPLGFANRRTDNLKKMSRHFIAADWTDVRELPGVGEYAARAWEIFVLDQLGTEAPKDHALVRYWEWRCSGPESPEHHHAQLLVHSQMVTTRTSPPAPRPPAPPVEGLPMPPPPPAPPG